MISQGAELFMQGFYSWGGSVRIFKSATMPMQQSICHTLVETGDSAFLRHIQLAFGGIGIRRLGRAVKALDLKSNGIFPRRFEPCSRRFPRISMHDYTSPFLARWTPKQVLSQASPPQTCSNPVAVVSSISPCKAQQRTTLSLPYNMEICQLSIFFLTIPPSA
eukprot:GHVT01062478.1.p1 GENE.GHVT01062478.1~~GHVT01062478.1.p1  ORF type:complete len:163 (+),score=10.56 GHVT01062478.1:61-549(+)